MPAGTIALTNNSTTVTGTGTSFTTELKVNDFVVAVVGGVAYTLGVAAIASNTSLTVIQKYDGPTTSGLSWNPVPYGTMAAITAQLAAQVTYAIRGLNLDKNNWQQIFTGTGNVTVNLPDGTSWTGPAWNGIGTAITNKADLVSGAVAVNQGGTGATTASGARTNLLNNAISWDLMNNEMRRYAFAAGRGTANVQGSGVWTFNNTPFGLEQYGTCIQVSNRSDSSAAAGAGVWQHYLVLGTGGNIIYAQNINNVYAAYTMRSTKNTTVDGSGFIKQASPIARLTDDPEKMGEEFINDFVVSGNVSVNEEAAGVTGEKIDTGVYRVTGSLGLAKDGWQIEGPKDINGNRLCFIETETNVDGILTLHVYKPKLDLETGGIKAGDSIDIPEGRWIDIRLDMPASKEAGS